MMYGLTGLSMTTAWLSDETIVQTHDALPFDGGLMVPQCLCASACGVALFPAVWFVVCRWAVLPRVS